LALTFVVASVRQVAESEDAARVNGEKSLAIIKNVHCGVGDRGRAALWFSVHITESSAALQVFEWNQAKEIIEAYGVEDVARLDGKPCWVDLNEPGIIRWIGSAQI
jgi:hypothetical protein